LQIHALIIQADPIASFCLQKIIGSFSSFFKVYLGLSCGMSLLSHHFHTLEVIKVDKAHCDQKVFHGKDYLEHRVEVVDKKGRFWSQGNIRVGKIVYTH